MPSFAARTGSLYVSRPQGGLAVWIASHYQATERLVDSSNSPRRGVGALPGALRRTGQRACRRRSLWSMLNRPAPNALRAARPPMIATFFMKFTICGRRASP